MGIFLNDEGVKGESSDLAHKDWVDVKNWQWTGERNMASASSTQGDRESSNTKKPKFKYCHTQNLNKTVNTITF